MRKVSYWNQYGSHHNTVTSPVPAPSFIVFVTRTKLLNFSEPPGSHLLCPVPGRNSKNVKMRK